VYGFNFHDYHAFKRGLWVTNTLGYSYSIFRGSPFCSKIYYSFGSSWRITDKFRIGAQADGTFSNHAYKWNYLDGSSLAGTFFLEFYFFRNKLRISLPYTYTLKNVKNLRSAAGFGIWNRYADIDTVSNTVNEYYTDSRFTRADSNSPPTALYDVIKAEFLYIYSYSQNEIGINIFLKLPLGFSTAILADAALRQYSSPHTWYAMDKTSYLFNTRDGRTYTYTDEDGFKPFNGLVEISKVRQDLRYRLYISLLRPIQNWLSAGIFFDYRRTDSNFKGIDLFDGSYENTVLGINIYLDIGK
jgi:hypothetical protein